MHKSEWSFPCLHFTILFRRTKAGRTNSQPFSSAILPSTLGQNDMHCRWKPLKCSYETRIRRRHKSKSSFPFLRFFQFKKWFSSQILDIPFYSFYSITRPQLQIKNHATSSCFVDSSSTCRVVYDNSTSS
jgi:hypothetical protein